MSVLRLTAASLVLAAALVLPAPWCQAAAKQSPMVERINHVRAAHGVRALRHSRNLARSSSRFGRYVLRADRFAHPSRIMARGRFSRLGEVLALTPGWSLRRAPTLDRWLGSESHRSILLSPSFRYVGAARVRGRFGRSQAVVWTVRFGG